MAKRILLVEDEPSLVVSLTDRLRSEGFAVEAVGDGEAAAERARPGAHDLILLDVMLPGRSGFDLCRELRGRGVGAPILMLTARGEVAEKVVALKLGADDYLTKPFDMLELLARIEALLRRAGGLPSPATGLHALGELEVDVARAEVRRGGRPVELSALEFRLLRYFLEHRGELLTRDRLLDEVWGYHADVYSRTVDQHVAVLRRKLEDHPARPRYLLTVHGLGYKFAAS